MRVMRRSFFGKAVSVFVLAMFVMSMNGSMGYAAAPAIKMKHDILEYFVPEKRIMVQAEVTQGASEVKLMRCYFRSTEYADYTFVEMKPEKGGMYKGILPAPSKETQMIEYLFLAADQKNQPVKTQVFGVKQAGRATPAWQEVSSAGNIQVSTELTQAPASVSGFSDSVTMNVVESSTRVGVVAGGGFSIYTVLGVGAAVAVAGGIVAVSGGDGGGEAKIDTISKWEVHTKCLTASPAEEASGTFTIEVNETKGVFTSDTGIGKDVTVRITEHSYDVQKRTISGIINTVSTLPFSCERNDKFSFELPRSNDTNYQKTIPIGSNGCGTEQGCEMEVRFIKK